MIEQRSRLSSIILWLLLIVGLALCAQAQQAVIHYVYDDLGRLVGVVDQEGNAATYTYDAVGNILAVGRHNVGDKAGPVAITLISPNKGKIGTAVSIFGKGFSADALQNIVSFSGAIATVSAASTNSISTAVPSGAVTGTITVTTPLGTATSPEPFMVLGVVTISPASAVLFPKATQQFTAAVSGTATPSVIWSVNGGVGGNATVGTISATGLYTAPAVIPSPQTLTVTATNTDDPALFASATVAIVPPPDKIFAHPVSIGFSAPTTISVNSLAAQPVSVEFSAPTGQTAFLTSPPVTVALQPVIVAVTPSTGLRGVAGLSVLLTGGGFANASSVSFQLNGSNDANLSVTNLTVSSDGTGVTFTLSIALGAVPGPRVVRITTPAGTSTAVGTGGNLFTVQ